MKNRYTEDYKELSEAALIECLKNKENYEIEAQYAMINEAIIRTLIKNNSEVEIRIGINNFNQSENVTTHRTFNLKDVNFTRIICYFFSLFFLLIGFYVLFNINNDIFVGSILTIVMLLISLILFRLPAKIEKRKLRPVIYNKPAEKGWLIAGYLFSLMGGFIAYFIGFDFYLASKKDSNGNKIYEYNENARKHGLNMIIINTIMTIIFITYRIIS